MSRPASRFESHIAEKLSLRQQLVQTRKELAETNQHLDQCRARLKEAESCSANANERWLRESRRNYELRKIILANNIQLPWE